MRRLLVLALLLLPVTVSAQVIQGSPFGGSSGGSSTFNGGDVSGQTNICGPDNATNVEIGSCTNDANGGTGGTSTVVGNASTNSGNAAGSSIFGSANTISATGANNLVLGTSLTIQGVAGASNIMIGNGGTCNTTGANNIVLGNAAACLLNGSNSFVAGGTAVNTGSNQFVAGGNGLGYLDVYFGEGVGNTTAAAWTLHGTGGSGADNAGGDLTIVAGTGTGNSAGEQVNINRGLMGATSSTAHPTSNGFTVCESKTLSNTTATATALATVAAASNSAGGFRVTINVTCTNGTEFAGSTVTSYQGYANKAGTISFGTATTQAEANGASTAGTINCTVAPTFVASGNTVEIRTTPVITGTPTTTTGYINVENFGTGAVTCN